MEEFKLPIMGLGGYSLLKFQEGFSSTRRIVLFFTGLQHFFLSDNLKSAFDHKKGIPLLPVLLTGIMFILTLKYCMNQGHGFESYKRVIEHARVMYAA